MKLNIGITVDLNNYEDYFKRFNKKYGCNALEFHLLERELEAGENDFQAKLEKVKSFVKENNIEYVAFHSPDRILQSVFFEEKSERLEDDRKKLAMLMNGLKKIGDSLGLDVIMVVHQGIKLPPETIDTMTNEELAGLRDLLLRKAKKSYDWLMKQARGSKLRPMLENSPPICAGDHSYHFIDLAFEDMAGRLGKNSNNGFVLDIGHAAMCVEYFKQKPNHVVIPALEALKRQYGGVPESLKSIEAYVRKAKNNLRWLHINDANGILGENEGHYVGVKGSVIDFKQLVSVIEKEMAEPVGVLEIVNSHKDYALIEKSMASLRK
jgi:hypothetical protein